MGLAPLELNTSRLIWCKRVRQCGKSGKSRPITIENRSQISTGSSLN
jgi:hypothetical protein